MLKKHTPAPVVVVKEWGSTTEIDRAIQKLERRKVELELPAALSAQADALAPKIRAAKIIEKRQ